MWLLCSNRAILSLLLRLCVCARTCCFLLFLLASSLSNTIPKPLSAMNHISSLEERWTKCSCFSLKKDSQCSFPVHIIHFQQIHWVTGMWYWSLTILEEIIVASLVHTLYFSQIWITGEELEHLRSRVKIFRYGNLIMKLWNVSHMPLMHVPVRLWIVQGSSTVTSFP